MRVAIVGIGLMPFRPSTPDLSWKELMYAAAVKAYADAGLDPREDIDSFVTCAEDYWEGFGIFDEFVPDQLGAVLKPTCTISGDGIHGLATAFMQIQSGLADVVAVESHSKVSDLLTYNGVVSHALDPIYEKPLMFDPRVVAGLDMAAFLRGGTTEKDCAAVVEANRRQGLLNDRAAHGASITAEDVMASPPVAKPLKKLDEAPLADGCVVLVLAGEAAAKKFDGRAVWLRGIGWHSESPWLADRTWGSAPYAEDAAKRAYAMAKLRDARREVDVAEVDDKFSYKELQHLEAIGLAKKGQGGSVLRKGGLPVNPSGGSLGCGNVLDASGLHRVAEVALQLRGEAGRVQVDDAKVGVAQSWRGLPTASGAVAVLGA